MKHGKKRNRKRYFVKIFKIKAFPINEKSLISSLERKRTDLEVSLIGKMIEAKTEQTV